MNRPIQFPDHPSGLPRPIEPLAAALARLEARWGSAAIRLGDGRSASLSDGISPGTAPGGGSATWRTSSGGAAGGTGPTGGGPAGPAPEPASMSPGTASARSFPVEGALAPVPPLVAEPSPDPLAPADDRVVPTGFPALDAILGPGGLVREAQVSLRGGVSSGKTTLALRLVAEAQARGAIVAWLDLARAFDPLEAVARGVDLAWLLVLRAPDATEGLRLAGALLGGRAVEVLVADLPERMPIDREVLLRRLAARARQAGARLVTLEPAGLAPSLRGALAESAGVGLDLERRTWIRAGRDVVGQRTQVTVAKNRFGPPGRHVELEIRYADEGDRGRGIDRLLDALPNTFASRSPASLWVSAPPLRPSSPSPPGSSVPLFLPGLLPRPSSASPPGSPAAPSSEIAIVGSTHETAPSWLAPPAPPARACVAPAPRSGRPGGTPLGSRTGARLQPRGTPPGRAARDEPRGRARARA